MCPVDLLLTKSKYVGMLMCPYCYKKTQYPDTLMCPYC